MEELFGGCDTVPVRFGAVPTEELTWLQVC